ncbi:hypothetical protein R1sor_011507 [Riccia sorocarpa]|uniref:Reverse transcriptase domain-containing protein n=1 Tax=Riccia sorocarpa TaxID=122646 RepID=A0ABD3I269_9MARC
MEKGDSLLSDMESKRLYVLASVSGSSHEKAKELLIYRHAVGHEARPLKQDCLEPEGGTRTVSRGNKTAPAKHTFGAGLGQFEEEAFFAGGHCHTVRTLTGAKSRNAGRSKDLPVRMTTPKTCLLLSTWNVGGWRVPHRRKRGVAILYKEDFQLLDSGEDPHGRYVWGHFQWIALDDWNAVISTTDSSSRSNLQAEDEAAVFQDLCNTLGVMDVRPLATKTEGPRFTRAQFHEETDFGGASGSPPRNAHGKGGVRISPHAPCGKFPGPDRMGPEIMKLLWTFIGETYYLAVVEFWSSGSLLPFFKDGLIYLIPKLSEPELIGHWRPITLLNATYKVLAKILAARLALVLPSLTPVEQQGFVKGRSPQNCIITFCLVHEVLKRQRKAALFISLDQEKAYDRLSPNYLWAVIAHLRFPRAFISAARALQEGAESRILLNNQPLSPFLVSRGVRQGCPLSPLLYVIASIPIIYRIRAENSWGRIRPVKIHAGCFVSSMCLVDDLAIFTELHRDSVANVLGLLNLVEEASGGKVNILKSKILMLGLHRRFSNWLRSLEFRLADPREVTTYMGAPLTTVWTGVDNGEGLITRLAKKAEFFSSPTISFESRVSALRHGIFPTLIYHMLVTKFKKKTFKKLDQVLREYVWSTDPGGRKKKSLSAWDNLVMPVKWGGLGVFSAEDFQVSLICRSVIKATQDPQTSLWAPIFETVFLKTQTGLLTYCLMLTSMVDVSACPVASLILGALILGALILGAWVKLFSLFSWGPAVGGFQQDLSLKHSLFLEARRTLGPKDSLAFATEYLRWCFNRGITSISDLRVFLLSPWGHDHLTHSRNAPALRQWLNDAQLPQAADLTLSDWSSSDAVLSWALSATTNVAFFRIWFLVVAWRCIWAERCTLKYQGKQTQVTLIKVAILMLEELNARKSKLDPGFVSDSSRQLPSVLSVVPTRFQALLELD